ncbi:MAG: sel1 repeat family protein [Propionivibrio sp.]|nr:sel1 repeat family protein [Propionivibrio sp.]
MIVLGRLSRSGVGLLQNYSQASKWIQTAADRGNPRGMLELGRLYRDGIGLDKDPVRAYVWFPGRRRHANWTPKCGTRGLSPER